MFASPFFTSGRAAILPRIASSDELHTANALTQTTQWATLTVGTMAAGISAATLGYTAAFVVNSLSFLFSAWAISRMRPPEGGFRAPVAPLAGAPVARPWHEYVGGAALHAAAAAHPGHRPARDRLGIRRRRRADPLHAVR